MNGYFKQKELNIAAKKADIEFRKGNLIEARKVISITLEPLFLMIEK
jgi:hypothetical protein